MFNQYDYRNDIDDYAGKIPEYKKRKCIIHFASDQYQHKTSDYFYKVSGADFRIQIFHCIVFVKYKFIFTKDDS